MIQLYKDYKLYEDYKKLGASMGEIIKVDVDKVLVGCEDGSVIDVKLSDVNFIPEIGDKVKVYKSDDSYYIVKKDDESYEEEKSYEKENKKADKAYEESPQNVTNNYYIDKNNNVGKRVHKIAYVLLAFFLGGLGVHKFYAGKFGMGFLYLLFSWTTIPQIIAFVEAILTIFTKQADEYGYIYL